MKLIERNVIITYKITKLKYSITNINLPQDIEVNYAH